jgi:hypothetical protein
VERRLADCGAAAEHQPDMPGLRPCVGGQSPDASPVLLCGMRPHRKRRCGRRDQHTGAGTPRRSLWRVGAVRPLSETGTRRSDSTRLDAGSNAVGIPGLKAGEDVKMVVREHN